MCCYNRGVCRRNESTPTMRSPTPDATSNSGYRVERRNKCCWHTCAGMPSVGLPHKPGAERHPCRPPSEHWTQPRRKHRYGAKRKATHAIARNDLAHTCNRSPSRNTSAIATATASNMNSRGLGNKGSNLGRTNVQRRNGPHTSYRNLGLHLYQDRPRADQISHTFARNNVDPTLSGSAATHKAHRTESAWRRRQSTQTWVAMDGEARPSARVPRGSISVRAEFVGTLSRSG